MRLKFLPGTGSNKYGRMDKISSVFGASTGGGEGSDTSPITEITGGENSSMCPSMGFKDRMIAFGVCTGIGIMFSIGGTINLFFMNYAGFAALYSLGTIISLCGTGFLRGPVKQIKSLTDPKRGVAVAILFTMIILTLVIALNDNIANPGKGILCLIFVAGQFLAYVWYCLTFIPYGRETVMGCCKSIC